MPTFWCSVPRRLSVAGITLESTPTRRSTTASHPVSSATSRITVSKRVLPLLHLAARKSPGCLTRRRYVKGEQHSPVLDAHGVRRQPETHPSMLGTGVESLGSR